jgi:HK97 gp10 family phage protein
MPERGVEIIGLREFRRELKQAGQQWPKELRQANKDAAEIVAADARRRAPRGPHLGGGRVRPVVSSIRALASQGRGQVAIGGASTPHAQVLEFGGTIPRRGQTGTAAIQARHGSFAKAGLSVTPVRAQPYLYPALAAKADEVVEFYGEALDRVYRRAFPRPF